VGKGRWKLIAANEPTVIAKPFLDSIVMEDGQCDRCFANPSGTYESDGLEVLGETDDLLDELVASKTGPWWRRRGFSMCARWKYKTLDTLVIKIANLVGVWTMVRDYWLFQRRIEDDDYLLPNSRHRTLLGVLPQHDGCRIPYFEFLKRHFECRKQRCGCPKRRCGFPKQCCGCWKR
jgi:hypothetical protein